MTLFKVSFFFSDYRLIFFSVIDKRRKIMFLQQQRFCCNFASILVVKESSKRKSYFSSVHQNPVLRHMCHHLGDDTFLAPRLKLKMVTLVHRHIIPVLIQLTKIIMDTFDCLIIVPMKMKCQRMTMGYRYLLMQHMNTCRERRKFQTRRYFLNFENYNLLSFFL